MSRVSWRILRLSAGAAVLAVVLWQTGSGPFLAGLRSLDATTLVLGAAVAVPTTVASAYRWRLVARGLGVGVGLGAAVASCYRSQFLNTALPGGVAGDVHRGVRHGRAAGDGGLGLRSVAWERFAGQVVQVAITASVLLLLPSPLSPVAYLSLAVLVGALAAAMVTALLLERFVPRGASSAILRTLMRVVAAARQDVLRGLLGRWVWPGVLLASVVAVAGHVTTYLLAAHAVGVPTSPVRLLPLALLALLAMAVPLNLAGWGPREGMAAWSFGAVGLGAGQGVATAVAYGVIVTVACLPGAVVLLLARGGPRRG